MCMCVTIVEISQIKMEQKADEWIRNLQSGIPPVSGHHKQAQHGNCVLIIALVGLLHEVIDVVQIVLFWLHHCSDPHRRVEEAAEMRFNWNAVQVVTSSNIWYFRNWCYPICNFGHLCTWYRVRREQSIHSWTETERETHTHTHTQREIQWACKKKEKKKKKKLFLC